MPWVMAQGNIPQVQMQTVDNYCQCPLCGFKTPSIPQAKCYQRLCPNCGKGTMRGMTCNGSTCVMNANI